MGHGSFEEEVKRGGGVGDAGLQAGRHTGGQAERRSVFFWGGQGRCMYEERFVILEEGETHRWRVW